MNYPIDVTGVVLRTERLILRPWCEEDLQDFYAYASVDGVGQMAGWTPHKDIEESGIILRKFIEHKKTFALELDGRVVGSLGVEQYDPEKFPELADVRCREIGYVLAKDCWGRGLMPEAVRAALGWLFDSVGLDAVLCAHFVRNTQSARVQEKCGFHYYKSGRYETRYGTVEDDITNILWKTEYKG